MHWKKHLFDRYLRSFSRKSCKKHYDSFYAGICQKVGIDKNESVDGEEEWVNKWSDLKYQWVLWCVFSFEMWAQMYLDSTPLEWKHVEI